MGNWQGEIPNKIRGLLGKTARIVLTKAHLDGPARRVRSYLRKRGGAGSSFSLLIPIDWFTGGPTPRFYASTTNPADKPTADIFTFREYSTKNEAAKPIAHITFRRTDYTGVLKADCPRALPPDSYVVIARNAYGNVLSVSAFNVRHAVNYDELFQERMKQREKAKAPAKNVSFSVTTTIYDTDPKLVEELYRDLEKQTYRNFEWLVLDNGSTQPTVVKFLQRLGQRADWVKVFRVEENIHIIPGNRYLLERAKGDYIVPVDSDDAIYPDALASFAAEIDPASPAPLLYSDEQKIAPDRHPIEVLWRPSWSRLLAQATCPSAHLMTFRRDAALKIGVYRDDYAKGCHDWDSVLRFSDAGYVPKRVPEVLYGWRIHGGSTAGSDSAKDYIRDSQLRNLNAMVKRNGFGDKFDVTPLEQLGYYHLTRKRKDAVPIEIFVVPSPDSALGTDEMVEHLRDRTRYPEYCITPLPDTSPETLDAHIRKSGKLVAIVGAHLRITNPDWLWDALGTFELDEKTALVGGQINSPDGKILHVGYVGGLRGFFGTPFYGADAKLLVFPLRIRRHVAATYGSFVLFRRDAIVDAGGFAGIDEETGAYGIDLCGRLRRAGHLIGWTSAMSADSLVPLRDPEFAGDKRELDTILDDPYYNTTLSLDPDRYGEVVPQSERDALLAKTVNRKGARSVPTKSAASAHQEGSR